MQVGLITVDGRQIGIVTMSYDQPDMTAPVLSGSDDIAGAYGGSDHYSMHPDGEGKPKSRHHDHREPEHRHLDHRHGPGRYERGEQREKTQEQKHKDRDLGNIPYSAKGNPFDRARFAKELEDKPWLREKIKHISLGENQDPHANLAVIETMMNRAVVRGTSLEQQAKRHRSSGKDEGGYYAGWAPHYSDAKGSMFERNMGEALKGSNITRYATDNSSGALAARERATGSFIHHGTINGENFFSPGHAEPALRDKWQRLNRQANDHEKSKTSESAAAKPFDPSTMVP